MSKRKSTFVEDNYTSLKDLLTDEILDANVIFDNYTSNQAYMN